VLRVCRALLGDTDADDAWSETFLAAMRAYPELPADANHEAWLVRIATNKSIDQHRARARRPVPAAVLSEPSRSGSSDGSSGVEPIVLGPGSAEAFDDDLRGAVAELPDKQRLAVTLHYLAGLPYAQVAEQLGGTPAAARRAAADGIASLRNHVTSPGGTR
jgi:RNA polymerase sigma factor (sigma-70 family)